MEFESVIDIYRKLDDTELSEKITSIKEELDELFRNKGDQDHFQGLRLHYAAAKREKAIRMKNLNS